VDLGIKGKWAVVCAASKGLGYGCARSLAGEGANLVINARTDATLQEAARKIRDETGVEVVAVATDITREQGRSEVLAAAPQVDILVTNAGGPPPGDFRKFTRDDWIAALDGNMLTPIELIKATVDKMIERKFGRIVNITSSAVKAPIDILGLSNGARSGLTGFIAGLSRTTVSANVTINNLLPGRFLTDRLRSNFTVEAKNKGITVEEAAEAARRSIPAKRFGDEMEFGQYCAWLCSQQAGYVTGQNLLIDGGNYPGTF
jgi:3-oxoacyl-[acyl-carrier protein] reductase